MCLVGHKGELVTILNNGEEERFKVNRTRG
jgi:hypothetical protein